MDFTVESKYPINIFKKCNLDCSWNTIQVGWDLKRLTIDEIHKFALDFSELHPELINEHISELIFSKNEYEIENLLKKIFYSLNLELPLPNSPLWHKEWQKWRYCILSYMVDQIQDAEELLIKVEGLYADFGYPEDMKSFIYYMPADEELVNLKSHEARNVLIKRLKNFLNTEKTELIEQINNKT